MFLCILKFVIHVHFIISECMALDKLEKTSQTVTGVNNILGDRETLLNILSPIRIWLYNPPSSSRYICNLCFSIPHVLCRCFLIFYLGIRKKENSKPIVIWLQLLPTIHILPQQMCSHFIVLAVSIWSLFMYALSKFDIQW